MAWIESHQALRDHPKTKRFARELKVSVPTALGHLHLLWWWALDYAQDGDLAEFDQVDIAEAAMWRKQPDDFICALQAAGFLDVIGDKSLLHDWDVYAGRLLDRRRKDAERKRTERGQVPDVQRTSEGHPSDGDRTSDASRVRVNRTVPTVPNQPYQPTVPYPTEPTVVAAAASPGVLSEKDRAYDAELRARERQQQQHLKTILKTTKNGVTEP